MTEEAATTSSSVQSQPQRSSSAFFEFTKRKKWTDILITEVPETVILVLNASRTVLYAAPGATEMLGWSVEEMLNSDVLNLISNDDQGVFQKRFNVSIASKEELFCYVRMKQKTAAENASNAKELLYEVKGRPLYLPDDAQCKCFFFMARPYPSRNMSILNTFLELKIENERLIQRVAELKAQRQTNLHSPSTATSTSSFGFLTQAGFVQNFPLFSEEYASSPIIDEEEDEGGRKRKFKKSIQTDGQKCCMTCGRTDSPEWRKGPGGPKTLCNACGLRWAKRLKKSDDALDQGTTIHWQVQAGDDQQMTPNTAVDVGPNTTGTGSSSSNAPSRRSSTSRSAPMSNPALSVTPVSANTNSFDTTTMPTPQQQQHSRADTAPMPRTGASMGQPSPTPGTFMHAQRHQSIDMPPPIYAGNPYDEAIFRPAHSAHHPQTSSVSTFPSAMSMSPTEATPAHSYSAVHSQFQDPYDDFSQWPAQQQHGAYPGY